VPVVEQLSFLGQPVRRKAPPRRVTAPPATDQRSLKPVNELEARYRRWRQTPGGAAVFRWCLEKAKERLETRRRFGVKQLVEVARWEAEMQLEPDAMGFKVNNSYASYLARELAARLPGVEALIEFRRVRVRRR
jgi:hypothetical protein